MIFQRADGNWRIDRQYTSYYDDVTQTFYPIADLLGVIATPTDQLGERPPHDVNWGDT